MSGTRPKTQDELTSSTGHREETPGADRGGTEPPVAKREPQSPASEDQLMEEVCERDNLERAWQRVRGNKGTGFINVDSHRSAPREQKPASRITEAGLLVLLVCLPRVYGA